LAVAPVANEDHAARIEIEDDSHVLWAFAHGNLVDRDTLDVLQARLVVMAFEMPFLDVTDHAPRNAQVMGNILARHASQEIQDISLERPGCGVASAWQR